MVGNVCAYYGCSSNVLHTPLYAPYWQTRFSLLSVSFFYPRKLLCPTKSAHNAQRKQTNTQKTTKIKRDRETERQRDRETEEYNYKFTMARRSQGAHVQLRRRFKHTTTSINYAHVQLRVRHGDGIAKAHVQLQHGACTTTTKLTARSLSLAVDMRREKKQEGHRD